MAKRRRNPSPFLSVVGSLTSEELRGRTMPFAWLCEVGWWQPMKAHAIERSPQGLCCCLRIPRRRAKPQRFGRAAAATPSPSTNSAGSFTEGNNIMALPKATVIISSVSNQVKALFHSRLTRLPSMRRVVAEIDGSSHG